MSANRRFAWSAVVVAALLVSIAVTYALQTRAALFRVEGDKSVLRYLGVRIDESDSVRDQFGATAAEYVSAEGPAGSWTKGWTQLRFVFEGPPLDEPFAVAPGFEIRDAFDDTLYQSADRRPLVGARDGRRWIAVEAATPRQRERSLFLGLRKRVKPIEAVNVTIHYFPKGEVEAGAWFEGPFSAGHEISHLGASIEIGEASINGRRSSILIIDRDSTSPLQSVHPAAIDVEGRSRGVRPIQRADFPADAYAVEGVRLDRLARLAIDLKPRAVVFRNAPVALDPLDRRTHAEAFDRMAEALGESLGDSQSSPDIGSWVRDPEKAPRVLEHARGPMLASAARTVRARLAATGAEPLDEESLERIRAFASRMLESPEIRVQGEGLRIALAAGFEEFIARAIDWLDLDPEAFDPITAHNLHLAKRTLVDELHLSASRLRPLSEDEIARLARWAARTDDVYAIDAIAALLGSIEGEAAARALADWVGDGDPGRWFPAASELAERAMKGERAELNDEARRRVAIADPRAAAILDDAPAPQTEDYLALLTPDLFVTDRGIIERALEILESRLTARELTEAEVDLLASIDPRSLVAERPMVVRIVRRINARHRTRLGGLVGGDRESPDLEFSIDPVELVEEVKRWRAELDPPASVD